VELDANTSMDANTRIRKKLRQTEKWKFSISCKMTFFRGPRPFHVVADIYKNIFKDISNLNFTI
jgi:hypothetical protein